MRGPSSFLKKHRSITLFLVLMIFSLASLGFSSRTLSFRPAEWGFAVVSVVQRGFSRVGEFFSGTVSSISELKKLKTAYGELQTRMSDYENLQSDLQKIREENMRLKGELSLLQDVTYSYIPAEVIAKDPVNLFDAIVINKGSVHGIMKNQAVVAFNNGSEGLVGRVIEVGPLSSKIMPLYDKNNFVAARMMTSRYEGLVHGLGGNDNLLGMDYVKKRARREIQYGDLVVTSGLNSFYPKNLYIGRLVTINSREWETSLTLELEPIIDFSRLEYVYVLDQEAAGE